MKNNYFYLQNGLKSGQMITKLPNVGHFMILWNVGQDAQRDLKCRTCPANVGRMVTLYIVISHIYAS